MNKKPKIKISEAAFNALKEMLCNNKEYSTVRLTYTKACCRPKIEIYLDSIQEGLILDSIEDLSVQYDSEFTENIKTVTLIYEKSSFQIKTEFYEETKKDCGGCHKTNSCGSCTGCRKEN